MRKQTLLKILTYVQDSLKKHGGHDFELEQAEKDLQYLISLED